MASSPVQKKRTKTAPSSKSWPEILFLYDARTTIAGHMGNAAQGEGQEIRPEEPDETQQVGRRWQRRRRRREGEGREATGELAAVTVQWERRGGEEKGRDDGRAERAVGAGDAAA